MKITIGRTFEIDTRHGLYIKVAGLGAGHRYSGGSWTWDSWQELQRVERSQEERRQRALAELEGHDLAD